jgi:L-lactate dehydrogenase (FMN-dependent) and related alpha-hydroxy acid dehydrogenases
MTAPVANIGDLRAQARRRIPRWIFDYADGGAYDERTLQANRDDLARLQLRQRVMVDVSSRSIATSVLGQAIRAPLAIAPTGLAGLFHPHGEIHGARAAVASGIPFCLSTLSICSIEAVRAATQTPFWFQIYVMRDRGVTRSLIERAVAAQCSALVLTLDLQVQGQRHRDVRNGLGLPPRLSMTNLLDMATRPRWTLGILAARRFSFGNLSGALSSFADGQTFGEWIAQSFDPSLTWDDVAWVRALWPRKLILKGVLDVEDAKLAVAAGADAVVVSNHGGRQLDGAPSSIAVLPRIAAAVGDRTEILFDGGVQSGQDVLKALALGARCCLLGKAYLYGLAAAGEPGVRKVIELISRELSVSMALTGSASVQRVDRSVLYREDQ